MSEYKGAYGFIRKLQQRKFHIYEKYPNVNKQFYEEFLPKQAYDMDGCFTLMTISQKRWGKTQLNFGVIDVLMQNKQRLLCCWDAPHLAEMLRPIYGDRVYATNKLDEVTNGSIIYIDEGLTKFNGKRALTKLSRKFGEALTYTSHKQIIIIVSAQTTGMIKDLRDKCEIIIYGRLPRPFLDSSTERFLKEEFDTLLTLPKEKAFILSSAFGFVPQHAHDDEEQKIRKAFGLQKQAKKGIGVLLGDKRERCTWFTDEISRNMSGETLDTELNKQMTDEKTIDQALEIIFKTFPEEFLKKINKRAIKGHFRKNERELHQYLNDANLWNDVLDVLAYEMSKREMGEIRENKQKVEENTKTEFVVKGKVGFPEYCRDMMKLKTKDLNLPEIVYQFISGISQSEIAHEIGISSGGVNQKMKDFRVEHMGLLWEKWFAERMGGGQVGGNSNEPDYIDSQGTIYSLKAYYYNQVAVTFYQSKDFAPEYYLAKKLKQHYTVVYLNPAWKLDGAIMIDVDPLGDERVVIRKPIKETLKNYKIFPIFAEKESLSEPNKEDIVGDTDTI